ncbi:hypothetical protein [Halostreptopolyspora alba]
MNTYIADHGDGYDAIFDNLGAQSTGQYDMVGEGNSTRVPEGEEN